MVFKNDHLRADKAESKIPSVSKEPRQTIVLKNYSDHSANERTFMAWIRTAISVMAFGFIVEKFDLFLEISSLTITGRELPQSSGQRSGAFTGLLLVLLGMIMIGIAAGRFWSTNRAINRPEICAAPSPRLYLLLASILILAAATIFFHLINTIFFRP
jgi:putative membrane protein